MSKTTRRREQVLHLIREERTRQVEQYGSNANLTVGFGGSLPYPWLVPICSHSAAEVQSIFRRDYERYVTGFGKPTWMHLIREEVAELFETTTHEDLIAEAIQVAALCASLVELLLAEEGTP